jgi:hypothetical protein
VHAAVADHQHVGLVLVGEAHQHLGRLARRGLARPPQALLVGELLGLREDRVDVLLGIDRPLHVVGGLALLPAQPVLVHRVVDAQEDDPRLVGLRQLDRGLHGLARRARPIRAHGHG